MTRRSACGAPSRERQHTSGARPGAQRIGASGAAGSDRDGANEKGGGKRIRDPAGVPASAEGATSRRGLRDGEAWSRGWRANPRRHQEPSHAERASSECDHAIRSPALKQLTPGNRSTTTTNAVTPNREESICAIVHFMVSIELTVSDHPLSWLHRSWPQNGCARVRLPPCSRTGRSIWTSSPSYTHQASGRSCACVCSLKCCSQRLAAECRGMRPMNVERSSIASGPLSPPDSTGIEQHIGEVGPKSPVGKRAGRTRSHVLRRQPRHWSARR